MKISCDDIEYAFASTSDMGSFEVEKVIGFFREEEGYTIIATTDYLNLIGLSFEGEFAMLSISIHTSLEMVGLTAVLATKLSDAGISANVVAGYYHDHIFVQYSKREKAVEALMAR